MLLACFLPLLPDVISKDTFCPSFSVLNPGMLIAEKCDFTVPVAILSRSLKKLNEGSRAQPMFNLQASKEPTPDNRRGRHSQELRTKHAPTVYRFLVGRQAKSKRMQALEAVSFSPMLQQLLQWFVLRRDRPIPPHESFLCAAMHAHRVRRNVYLLRPAIVVLMRAHARRLHRRQ
jgi:hypothetical protein